MCSMFVWLSFVCLQMKMFFLNWLVLCLLVCVFLSCSALSCLGHHSFVSCLLFVLKDEHSLIAVDIIFPSTALLTHQKDSQLARALFPQSHARACNFLSNNKFFVIISFRHVQLLLSTSIVVSGIDTLLCVCCTTGTSCRETHLFLIYSIMGRKMQPWASDTTTHIHALSHTLPQFCLCTRRERKRRER